MQSLNNKGIPVDTVLSGYDLIIIPNWVLNEIKDSHYREAFVQGLIDKGFPVCAVNEQNYYDLAEGNDRQLLKVVVAATKNIAELRRTLGKEIEGGQIYYTDYKGKWLERLYELWPLEGDTLSSGRKRKKNAGEISITILAEIISWFYLDTKSISIYSHDSDAYNFQKTAENFLHKEFSKSAHIPVSFKSNDSILCQLFRDGIINEETIKEIRTESRTITYIKELFDKSIVQETMLFDTDGFLELIRDNAVRIIF
ncbi:MAG: hypothetical protein ACI4WM_00530 [Erysipelotrichaceae bacterium]